MVLILVDHTDPVHGISGFIIIGGGGGNGIFAALTIILLSTRVMNDSWLIYLLHQVSEQLLKNNK